MLLQLVAWKLYDGDIVRGRKLHGVVIQGETKNFAMTFVGLYIWITDVVYSYLY